MLRLVSDRCIDCFLPAVFEAQMRRVRQIDGAGLRLDAEFKLVKRIRTHGRRQQGGSSSAKRPKVEPYISGIACRGARGLFLAPLTPSRTGERGENYQHWDHCIGQHSRRRRRIRCCKVHGHQR